MNVLIIEDDFLLGELYKDALSMEGFDVALCQNAADGLVYLLENDVKVLILDLMLSSENGVELMHEMQSRPDLAKIPIIIQSAFEPSRLGLEPSSWLKYGVVEYLHKVTARPKHLIRAVKSYARMVDDETI